MEKLTSPFEIIKNSWEVFTKKQNFVYLVKIYSPIGFLTLISLAFAYVPFFVKFFETSMGDAVMLIFNILFIAFAIFINLSGIIAVMGILDGKVLQVRSVYEKAFSKYGKFFLLTIVIFSLYILGLILLIVPLILFIAWFSFTEFVYVEKETGINASLTESKKLVKGRFWKIFWRISMFGLFSVLSQIILTFLPYEIGTITFNLIGALYLIPQILLYREVSSKGAVNG
ncbi:MAG: seg [Microgenomates group bacterium GW2011_GWC1_41_20]|uniref:Glycerophosphoryl diester phosphodiesterase membrane domain-containing protein n=6 Tax=Candidatus Woeseibacteriota TaxID=1752722 RepID=A0A0G0V086_9BACT|nr:MAG: hypothetical protein UT76_C0026G0005 [Candidatus Woesebacteria bacterium GW2011_GWB1_40_12]KKR55972.1 MAG: hypothetical protein UT93_C0009G0015 [Candidatus Woesebacteria bacterium GW2011_GWF1_40_24]KKR99443.1 MAG: seg [Microgenomates group bacterium GW2011_GWC1_41_20]KKS04054.1 MAG: hypothetical protein UU57_C0025G0007 [Candidatus Woesebacteria bacterium GW2011_GWE1_41_24]KKS18683.1 MAG: hypothetical protein UU74_C0003G0004 [Candidatus Woesebacteria bacterium GW2011_GWA1_41_7]OGM80404.